MGVRSLTSLVEENPELLQDYELSSSTIVVDAYSVMFSVFEHYRADYQFTGNYDAWSHKVRRFLDRLVAAEVKAVFIFDGQADKYGKKFKTTLERQIGVVKRVKNYVNNGKKEPIYPHLMSQVYLSIIKSYGFPVLFCWSDADPMIAAHSNFQRSPVLGQDSDFFIFPLVAGYIPFRSLNLHPKWDGSSVIRCSLYLLENWKLFLPSLDTSLMPIFAMVAGNDYFKTNCNQFTEFFASIDKPYVPENLRLRNSNRQCNLVGVLEWLQKKTFSEAVALLMQSVNCDQRVKFEAELREAAVWYKIEKLSAEEIIANTVTSLQSIGYPSWITDIYCDGDLFQASRYLCHRQTPKMILTTLIENLRKPSVYECSKSLRQIIYGIVLNESAHDSVLEYCRKQETIVSVLVPKRTDVPSLSAISEMDVEKCRSCILSLLEMDSRLLFKVPQELQLLLVALCFWRRVSQMHMAERFALAIVGAAFYVDLYYQRLSDALDEGVSCAYERNWKRFRVKPDVDSVRMKQRYFDFVHMSNEFQTCVDVMEALNQLFKSPFLSVQAHEVFSGYTVANLYFLCCVGEHPTQSILKTIPIGAKAFGVNGKDLFAVCGAFMDKSASV